MFWLKPHFYLQFCFLPLFPHEEPQISFAVQSKDCNLFSLFSPYVLYIYYKYIMVLFISCVRTVEQILLKDIFILYVGIS